MGDYTKGVKCIIAQRSSSTSRVFGDVDEDEMGNIEIVEDRIRLTLEAVINYLIIAGFIIHSDCWPFYNLL